MMEEEEVAAVMREGEGGEGEKKEAHPLGEVGVACLKKSRV